MSSAESVRDAIVKQVEYYFSNENLMRDYYLLSRMDAHMFVPVDVIAGFKKMKLLTSDRDAIIEAMKASEKVVLSQDAMFVQPKLPVRYNTVRIHGIPANTPVDNVKSHLEFQGAPILLSLYFDAENTWFAVYETEASAKYVLDSVQSKPFQQEQLQLVLHGETVYPQIMPYAPPVNAYYPPGAVPGYYPPYAGAVAYPYAPYATGPQQQPYAQGPREEANEARRQGDGRKPRKPSSKNGAPFKKKNYKGKKESRVAKNVTRAFEQVSLTSDQFPSLPSNGEGSPGPVARDEKEAEKNAWKSPKKTIETVVRPPVTTSSPAKPVEPQAEPVKPKKNKNRKKNRRQAGAAKGNSNRGVDDQPARPSSPEDPFSYAAIARRAAKTKADAAHTRAVPVSIEASTE